ncbi:MULTISPECIES: sulfite oxidase [Cytobacillus]|jgi:DMSO/TMAO reductase YedYZ molybdopterin-dependent catalytic subunit|uniref:Sulfite oxidase n=1 Tax=Cytobacillus oceanisediminis 2691 TaxID=1196031 RepID=A0A160MAZ7_9BACI|nr:sulfite oxidase [Cytobacillus oceanisediminis]AND39997.1 sulfite oxidase [Cytobacillus oceanisediminis 2691]MBU8728725.1 sulfite oxidase [Cytobacillus oceanisediminis]MBY0156120.1 sulfite oxidase [Cytobacillus firmus]USK46767.1 sulfite oxidase [Cytobacillus oceanisediminis]
MNNQLSAPYLKTLSLSPENQESPIHFLECWKTPQEYFYLRNHFSYPLINPQNLFLSISGNVNKAMEISLSELYRFPSKTILVPLECAGNNRAKFKPKVFGEQWEEGAVSQGKWKGVPLKELLNKAGLLDGSKEAVFAGLDFGERKDLNESFYFARSLPIEKALHEDTIVAYEFNGKPLPYKQGYPFRLIVPQWYAMASVKWLRNIFIIQHEFNGPFQSKDYVYYPYKDSDLDKRPVTAINVNSTIQQPLNYSIIKEGFHTIRGIAWTGTGAINEVAISIDHGDTWRKTSLKHRENEKFSWVKWHFDWEAYKGEHTILVRASDSEGNIQPIKPYWNRKGYGYNAVQKIKIRVE